MLSVCPYVCTSVPTFQNLAKQNKAKFTTGETVGLGEWIIGDTCLCCLLIRYQIQEVGRTACWASGLLITPVMLFEFVIWSEEDIGKGNNHYNWLRGS